MLWISKVLILRLHPSLVSVGEGILDWHVSPHPDYPAGRYQVVEITECTLVCEYVGPVPGESNKWYASSNE
jgi:hypothetical protein